MGGNIKIYSRGATVQSDCVTRYVTAIQNGEALNTLNTNHL